MRPAGAVLLLLVASAAASAARAQPDACRGVVCSGAGTCFDERGAPQCLCDDGFSELGLECIETTDGDVLRLRRVAGVGERAVEIAVSQLGRRLSQIGNEEDSLVAYMSAREWWCGDFVSWVYNGAGVPFSGGSAGGWLVTNNLAIAAWFEQRGLWFERGDESFTPRPGDYMRLPTQRGGHAAIVQQVIGSTLYAVEGNVDGRVEITPYYHYRQNPLIGGFGRLELESAPPAIEAGERFEMLLGHVGVLHAEVSDDGPDENLGIAWVGVEAVHFGDASARRTTVRFDEPGSYLVRLRVDDGQHVVTDDVRVDVIEEEPPVLVETADPSGSSELRASIAGCAIGAAPRRARPLEALLVLSLVLTRTGRSRRRGSRLRRHRSGIPRREANRSRP